MRVAITGERGFIATNLISLLEQLKAEGHDVEFVSLRSFPQLRTVPETGEPCVWRNSAETWAELLKSLSIDVLINNAAIVNSDVVEGSFDAAHRTNVQGTLHVSLACERAGIRMIQFGTTVGHVSQAVIDEYTEYNPQTAYGWQKGAADSIVKASRGQWLILRPMFCFGGIGDHNSMISKLCYAAECNVEATIRLDPNSIKQWMHVSDFCRAVVCALQGDLWAGDFFVSAEVSEARAAGEVARMCCNEENVKWLPETDYLGNHVASSAAFQSVTDWRPVGLLRERILAVKENYKMRSAFGGAGFNPLALRKFSADE